MKKQLIPQLRFSEFEGEWENKKMGEVNSVLDSLHQTPRQYVKQGYSMVRVTDVNNTELDIDKCLKVSEKDYLVFTKRHTPEKGDIIMTRVGTCGESIKLSTNEPICLGQNTVLLIPTVNKNYVFSFMKSKVFKTQVDRLVVGSTQKTLSLKDFKKIKITLPIHSLEQQKIASFLTDVDDKITKLTKKKTLLAQYKKGVMQKIFNQELRFKDDEGNDFSDWEEKKLSDLGLFKNGVNKSKKDFGFGLPFVNLMDVFGKPTISDLDLGLINSTKSELENYSLKKGDVLFIRSSVKREGVGATSLLLTDLTDTVYSGFLIRFRFKYEVILSFKKYCFNTSVFRKKLLAKSTTSANTNINQESLNTLTVLIPNSLEEQTKIANFLSDIDQKIEVLNTKIENTKSFKKGLLQQMFV